MNLFRKIDNYLLVNHPEVWLSRIHLIIPGAFILLTFEIWLSNLLPLSLNYLVPFYFITFLFLFFLAFWWRFQKKFFEPNMSFAATYRLFLWNTLCMLFLVALLCVIPLSISKKISHIDVTTIEQDLLTIRLDNIPEKDILQFKQYVHIAFDSVQAKDTVKFPEPPWLVRDTTVIIDVNDHAIYTTNPFVTESFPGFNSSSFFDTSLNSYYAFADSAEKQMVSETPGNEPLLRQKLTDELMARDFQFASGLMDILIVKSMKELDSIKIKAKTVYAKYGLYKNNGYYPADAAFAKVGSNIRSLDHNYEFRNHFGDGLWALALLIILVFSFLSMNVLLNKNIWLSILAPVVSLGIIFLIGVALLNIFRPFKFYVGCYTFFIALIIANLRTRLVYTALGSFLLQLLNYAVLILVVLLISEFCPELTVGENRFFWSLIFLFFAGINYFFILQSTRNIFKPQK